MDPNYLNYGYTPVYHQLQSTSQSPDPHQQQQQQFVHYSQPQRPQSVQNDTNNQTVPSMPNFMNELPMKIEKPDMSDEQPEQQQQVFQQSPIQYQNEQFSIQQNFQNFQNPNFIPSIFNPHQFQPVPMWHGNDNGYSYSQVVPQYPPVPYHSQPFDQHFMMRPPMGYQVGFMRPSKSPVQAFSPQPSPVNYQQQAKTFSCSDCNKTFMSITNLKRHMTTRVHFNKIKRDNLNESMIVERGDQTFEVKYMETQQQQQPQSSTSITDLSEAEVVLIDKIDKELSSIEPSSWNVLRVEPSFSGASSPLPVVSSTQSMSSPDGIGEFRCNICNKTFAKRCYFTQHNKTAHVGHKPYKCTKCGKKYQSQEAVDDHMNKHDGEKPFKCEACTKSFNHKTDLKRHSILHTTEKPHVCQQCGKGFIRKDHLQKHIGSHKRKMEKLKRVFTGDVQIRIKK